MSPPTVPKLPSVGAIHSAAEASDGTLTAGPNATSRGSRAVRTAAPGYQALLRTAGGRSQRYICGTVVGKRTGASTDGTCNAPGATDSALCIGSDTPPLAPAEAPVIASQRAYCPNRAHAGCQP